MKSLCPFAKYFYMVTAVYFCSCSSSSNLIEKSGEWERISYGEYIVENCTWNTSAIKGKWKEAIFYDTINGETGWKWDIPLEKDPRYNSIIKTFPEIIYGRKPYEGYSSTTGRLPAIIGSVKIDVEFDYRIFAEGVYNISTDISFTDSNEPAKSNIRAKLMIWLGHKNMDFFSSAHLKDAVIGGLPHKIYIDTNHIGPEGKWNFVAVLPAGLPSKGRLDLSKYFNYFLSEKALHPDWFLSSIEIGSEIASGKGEIIFKQFKVNNH